MQNWIALFRGINVGGHRLLPMQRLVSILGDAGCREIATYIQSGNVVFRHAESDPQRLGSAISRALQASLDFEPLLVLLTYEEFASYVNGNPYVNSDTEQKSLHVWFLAVPADNPDLEKMRSLRSGNEAFQLSGKVLYLHAPDGIGRSRLAAAVERLLGVPATARNWRTVNRILEMSRANGGG